METHSLEVTRTIAAPRDRVFAAFLQKTGIMEHFAPTGPDGKRMQMVLHTFEPRVGGAMEYSMCPAGADPAQGGHKIVGVYKKIEDGERIVRTEAPGMPDGSTGPETVVSFLFEDAQVDGAAATQVTIRHEGIPDPNWAKGAEMGWGSALENLAAGWEALIAAEA
ncbi:MAG: SRPBCC family protein [Thermoplasmatota archaeon]